MKFDSAGFPFVAIAALPSAVALWLHAPAIAAVLALLPLAVLLFFRDPDRSSPQDSDVVLSPADGRVMHAGPARPDEAPPGPVAPAMLGGDRAPLHRRALPCRAVGR